MRGPKLQDRGGWGVVLALVAAVAGCAGPDRDGAGPPAWIAAAPTAQPTSTPTRTPSATPSPAAPLLRHDERPPREGDGTFAYGATGGDVAGTAGPVRRYRIAVERGAGVDVEEFGAEVDAALADRRGWHAGGRLRLQRVAAGTPYDFTVHLATSATAYRMCAAGGTNNRIGGVSYTSCRAFRNVIVHLDRWMLSVDHFVAAKIPLATYRAYVVNHEVGHELGHGHVRCPARGRPAPVMMKQTLSLDGCAANPWPYVNGRLHTGPAL